MAVANGFGKVVTSGSVFMYDTGDTYNSYIGEPTTNLYTTLGFGFYQQEGNHTATRTVGVAPNLNLPTNYDYTTIVTTGNWQAEVNRIIIWTNTSLTSGTYNISFWARVTSTSTATIGCAFYGNNINNTLSLTNQWQRFSFQSTTHPLYRATEFGSLSGAITFQIAGLQIESISHATPYVNGIRSTTQGLLPLVGNSTINLSNMSYDSNAQMTFDGTDDRFNTGIGNIGNNTSFAAVINSSGNATTYNMYMGQLLPYMGALTGNRIIFSDYINSIQQTINTSVGTIITGQNHYVVCTREYDGTNTTNKVYIDGKLSTSGTFSGAPTYYGDTIHIGDGQTSAWYPFYGKINVVQIYNRTLSVAEVTQNYNKYKTRFNLA
jgi:hypothetical protein